MDTDPAGAAAFAAWQANVTTELGKRPFESLVSTILGGQRIEPLGVERADGRGWPTLARAGEARVGAVLRAGEAAPEGPSAAWWCGAPGALASSTRVVVLEGDVSGLAPGIEVLRATHGRVNAPAPPSLACDGVTPHERGAAA